MTRKERSEQQLKEEGIKINAHLPHIAAEEETTLRSLTEITQRLTVLCAVNLAAFNNLPSDEIASYLQEHNLWSATTPKEKAFLHQATEQEKLNETWKCEGIWVLFWALGIIDQLAFPDTMCNLNEIEDDYPLGTGYPLADPHIFLNKSFRLRSKTEILDLADLYYRYDWACVNARVNAQPMEMMNPGIVYERHYALNWLINYQNQAWDDISCDT